MQLGAWLQASQDRLKKARLATARLDALVLLEDCLQQDRAQLLAHPEIKLSTRQLATLDAQLQRRSQHEPLAYICGKSEFYGREFYVDHHVLEPRPESETMIELLKGLPLPQPTIADIGTGSGALAVTAALELPAATVYATDIDPACLQVATQNNARWRAGVSLYAGDLLMPLADQPLDILLCNLPYVPADWPINLAASHEPQLAIFGGPDGLDLYRQLFKQLQTRPQKPRFIISESLPAQHAALGELVSASGYRQAVEADFIQLFELAL